MRIAVWHNLPSGGAKRALYYHVRGLVEYGHTVESWCPSTADQSYLPISELIAEHITPLNWEPPKATNRLARLLAIYGDRVHQVDALDEHCRQCAVEINEGSFDVLFANTSMAVHAGPIGRYVRIPKVLYLQEPNRWLYEALPHLPWIAPPASGRSWWNPKYLKGKIPEWLNLEGLRVLAREELISAKAYDAILTNSLFSHESIMRNYGLSAKVCYLGVDTSLFRPLSKKRERFIVSVGAVLRFKGIELAIKSISLLNDPRLPLVWVANSGDPEYAAEMKRLAASLNVNLQLKMRISDTELVDILNRAAMMLYTPQLEPFGFAPLEANACATPVVAVAEGGVRETVKDNLNGLLVAPEPRCIAEAVKTLLNDPALARRYGEQAAEYVRSEWNLGRSIDRLETCLLESAHPDRICSGSPFAAETI